MADIERREQSGHFCKPLVPLACSLMTMKVTASTCTVRRVNSGHHESKKEQASEFLCSIILSWPTVACISLSNRRARSDAKQASLVVAESTHSSKAKSPQNFLCSLLRGCSTVRSPAERCGRCHQPLRHILAVSMQGATPQRIAIVSVEEQTAATIHVAVICHAMPTTVGSVFGCCEKLAWRHAMKGVACNTLSQHF